MDERDRKLMLVDSACREALDKDLGYGVLVVDGGFTFQAFPMPGVPEGVIYQMSMAMARGKQG